MNRRAQWAPLGEEEKGHVEQVDVEGSECDACPRQPPPISGGNCRSLGSCRRGRWVFALRTRRYGPGRARSHPGGGRQRSHRFHDGAPAAALRSRGIRDPRHLRPGPGDLRDRAQNPRRRRGFHRAGHLPGHLRGLQGGGAALSRHQVDPALRRCGQPADREPGNGLLRPTISAATCRASSPPTSRSRSRSAISAASAFRRSTPISTRSRPAFTRSTRRQP